MHAMRPLRRGLPGGDPALPPDEQDKRSVIPIERVDFEQWLAGTVEEAAELMRVTPPDAFDAGPTAAKSHHG